MIDFNKIEEYFISVQGLQIKDVKKPEQPFIKCNELIRVEESIKLHELIKKYHVGATITEYIAQHASKRNGKFIFEGYCPVCKKRYISEEWHISSCGYFASLDEDAGMCSDCEDEMLREQEKIEEEEKRKQQEFRAKLKAQHDEKIRNIVKRYIEKYRAKSFDFYDTIGLFFKKENNKEDYEVVKLISKEYDILDFMKVAFDEPQKQEKTNYIIENYSFNNYSTEFLNTLYWKTIADLRKEKDHHCQMCGVEKNLAVHHKGYKGIHGEEHLKENFENNLITLCTKCHNQVHETLNIE